MRSGYHDLFDAQMKAGPLRATIFSLNEAFRKLSNSPSFKKLGESSRKAAEAIRKANEQMKRRDIL